MRIKDVITRLAEDSDLGEALFKDQAAQVSMLHFQRALVQRIPALVSTCTDEASFRNAMGEVQQIVSEYEEMGVSNMKREIRLEFMRCELPLVVIDMAWEGQLRLMTALKSRALGQEHGLPLLLYETWLAEPQQGVCACAKLLQGCVRARQLAASMLRPEAVTCLTDVKDILIAGSEALLAQDAFFVVELAFVKSALEDAIAKSLEKALLATMPSAAEAVSLEGAAAAVALLGESQKAKVGSHASRAQIETAGSILTKMMRGSLPARSL